MRFFDLFLAVASIVGITAEPFQPPQLQGENLCNRYRTMGRELAPLYFGVDGKCTSVARSSIRMAFHDCFADECNGSLILSDECSTRGENHGMRQTCAILHEKRGKFQVGAADLIQFAAALGTAFCHGPNLKFQIGRKDRMTASRPGQIPGPQSSKESMMTSFQARNLNPRDVVALMGAHSAGFNSSGFSFDNTPHALDNAFYRDTLTGKTPAFVRTDRVLAQSGVTGKLWKDYGEDQALWDTDFTNAMEKLGSSGFQGRPWADCSSVIPEIFAWYSNKLAAHGKPIQAEFPGHGGGSGW